MASCPSTCVDGSTCDEMITERAAQGVSLSCAFYEHQLHCDCRGCQCHAIILEPQLTTTSSTTRSLPIVATGDAWYRYSYSYGSSAYSYHNQYKVDGYYWARNNGYYAYYDDSISSSSMLWVIIAVAAVFVIATSILGYLIYRRRRRLRMLALQRQNDPERAGNGGARNRAVTEIAMEDVAALPYVERIDEEPNSPAYPVAQSLTVVPSRGPSRQSSVASFAAATAEAEASDAAAPEPAPTPNTDAVPLAMTSLQALIPDNRYRARSDSCCTNSSVNTLGEVSVAQPPSTAAATEGLPHAHGYAVDASNSQQQQPVMPTLPPHHAVDSDDDSSCDSVPMMPATTDDDEALQLAQALSLSMQTLAADEAAAAAAASATATPHDSPSNHSSNAPRYPSQRQEDSEDEVQLDDGNSSDGSDSTVVDLASSSDSESE